MNSFDMYDEIPLKTVLRKTSTMHWMVLGPKDGRLPPKLGVDCVLEVAFKKQWTKTMFFASAPTLVTLKSSFVDGAFRMLDCNYLRYQYCVSSCSHD